MNNTECPICLRQESPVEDWDKETCEFVSLSSMKSTFGLDCEHKFCVECLWELRMFNYKTGITNNTTKFEAPCPLCREDIGRLLQQNYYDNVATDSDEELTEE